MPLSTDWQERPTGRRYVALASMSAITSTKTGTLIDPGIDDQTANVQGYTPENSQTLNDIVRGTGPQNAVRYTGNLLGKGGGLGAMVARAVYWDMRSAVESLALWLAWVPGEASRA